MDLREYMFRNRISSVSLASQLDCSRQLITAIRSGKKCGKRLAKDIELLTGGQVKAAEILNPTPIHFSSDDENGDDLGGKAAKYG